MHIYLDENFPPAIAHALNLLQAEKIKTEGITVFSTVDVFRRGALDEDIIPALGKEKGILITQDLNIHRVRQQRILYFKHGIGIFFFKPPSRTGYSYWQMVEQIVRRWADMKHYIRKNNLPFGYQYTSRGAGTRLSK